MGMKQPGFDAHGFEEGAEFRLDLVETLLRIVLQVHLVDKHDDLADAQQVEQVAVAARLLLDALVGVNQQQGRLGVGRAGDHVFEKLLVARGVNDDVLALGVRNQIWAVSMVMFWSRSAWRASIRLAHSKGTPRRLGDGLELLQFALGQRAGVVEAAGRQRWICRGPHGRR